MGLGLREPIGSWHVVRHSEVLEATLALFWANVACGTYRERDTGVASLIQITNVGTSTVGVNLVDGHRDLTPGLDLGDGLGRKSILGVLSDVDISRQFRAATLVDDIGLDFRIADDGGVLLAGVDGYAVAGDGRID